MEIHSSDNIERDKLLSLVLISLNPGSDISCISSSHHW